jgi:catechol 2,3-dioxygenase-like lactoylglutathione lyase family enzyme
MPGENQSSYARMAEGELSRMSTPATNNSTPSIRGLHHAAYRCRNSEETRGFYEDFLELPLVEAFPINTTATGRQANVLHTFFQMADGSCLAFFEAREQPFEFKSQHDFDLHIALAVDYPTLERMLAKGKAEGIDTRGVSDHGFIHSIYFRDPNGYVVELAAPVAGEAGDSFNPAKAAERLAQWHSGGGG